MAQSQLQIDHLKQAIGKVVKIGPDFLSKKISPEDMTHAMVNSVQEYKNQSELNGGFTPHSAQAEELLNVLKEIKGCGSGYLAKRCDADCVARTITFLVDEFGENVLVNKK